jgi:hypothetical protein
MPRSFVSYSWDTEEHRNWVRGLATRLRQDGIETTLDQWHLVPGDQLPAFMERAVRESDYVLIVCTPRYKQRSDNRTGGVGYEGDIMAAEALTARNERKFVPILRQDQWLSSAPSWLSGKYYVDLSGEPYSEHQYMDLLTTMLGARPQAPPVGRRAQDLAGTPGQAAAAAPEVVGSAPPSAFDPLRVTGVIVDDIGTPRGDGIRGGALYTVPFRLSRRPPSEWVRFFIEAWNHPPRFTLMHRPGIASVHGDKVVLDGTTVEEVERYHRDTLILAADQANRQYQELEADRRTQEQQERERIEAHRKSVADAASRIKF